MFKRTINKSGKDFIKTLYGKNQFKQLYEDYKENAH